MHALICVPLCVYPYVCALICMRRRDAHGFDEQETLDTTSVDTARWTPCCCGTLMFFTYPLHACAPAGAGGTSGPAAGVYGDTQHRAAGLGGHALSASARKLVRRAHDTQARCCQEKAIMSIKSLLASSEELAEKEEYTDINNKEKGGGIQEPGLVFFFSLGVLCACVCVRVCVRVCMCMCMCVCVCVDDD